MPKRLTIDPRLDGLVAAQDWVVSRDQALGHGHTRHSIEHRLAIGTWTLLLPNVYLCTGGEPSRRQMLIAAQLYGGPEAAIDGVDACRYYGLKAVPVEDDRVHIVVPWGSTCRSLRFVVVRRTTRPISVVATERLRYVEPATALIAATRGMRRSRSVLAALSDAVQRGVTDYPSLLRANALGPRRNAQFAGEALAHIGVGVRSAPEADARVLLEASDILPRPIYNCLLRLPDGGLISPDALIEDAGLVHETNGRLAHWREDLFEDMQVRHDVMTAAGLTVLHNSPRRLRLVGAVVLAQLERCYVRLAGSGLPPGVTIVRSAA